MPARSRSRRVIVICLAACVFLASCTGSSLEGHQVDWKLTQVRLHDAVDSQDPQSDFVALYARLDQGELQIRIDWLEQDFLPSGDLYLAIDNLPGGNKDLPGALPADIAWETLILVSSSGNIQSLDANYGRKSGLQLRVTRDPILDTLMIQMDGALATASRSSPVALNRAPVAVKFQLVLVDPATGDVLDRSRPFGLHDGPHAAAKVLLAFSNVFPAYTPSLTLRRWDGAHSGPMGGRHGLFNLLRAAYGDISFDGNLTRWNDSRQTPIFLLDLKSPASLSALDFASALPEIQALTRMKPLELVDHQPAVDLPGEPYRQFYLARMDETQRRTVLSFGLSPSNSLYTSSDINTIPAKYQVVFVDQPDPEAETNQLKPTHVSSWKGKILVPYSPGLPVQATQAGPTLELRTALVETALMNNGLSVRPDYILMLGGDLPASTWGDPASARSTFRYLESRPWIDILDAGEINSLHPLDQEDPGIRLPLKQEYPDFHAQMIELVEALLNAPDNVLTDAAWLAVESFYAPLYPLPEHLYKLRASYLDSAWTLLYASNWFETPYEISSCEVDLNRDGRTECILASKEVFSALDVESGALTALFVRDEDLEGQSSVHQLVGSSSQLITGLSEPADWMVKGDLLLDPAVIPGAFALRSARLQPQPHPGGMAFLSNDNQFSMVYSLLPGGLALMIETESHYDSVPVSIPVLYDPWIRFQSGWAQKYVEVTNGESWQLWFDSHPVVQIISSSPVTSESFLASLPYTGYPEDPNLEFGKGHYLPFPLFLLSIPYQPVMQVEITSP